ncbi:MAG TPA: glycosyltransferase [Devosia sp.]|nr:glycosyltransferase [Devosia sp.]
MAIDADRRAVDAVASLLAEGGSTEVAVVNTGGASLRGLLAAYLDSITLVEADTRRLPGGSRNLGIAATSAPLVAFLAADCLASRGWVAQRLAAHAQGHLAVATALRPAPDGTGRIPATSWASYALLHVRRAPEYPAASAARYGASYDRWLFDRHGWFREDMRVGEDTEFNGRVSRDAPLAWAPEVVTLHRYPATIRRGLADFVERGRHLFRWFEANDDRPLVRTLRRAAGNWRIARALAGMTSGETQRSLRRAAPLITLFALAYGCGGVAAAFSNWFRRANPR